jgi:hypothetical protein
MRRGLLSPLFGKWSIYDPYGNVIFYCEQKWSLRTDVRIYSDKNKQQEVLLAKTKQIIGFSAAYNIWDSTTNEKIGVLKRKGWKSFLRDEWIIIDKNDKEIGIIREDSQLFALLRRFFLGWLLPKKYSGFIGQTSVCIFKKHFNPFIWKTSIDFSQDINNLLDRRIGIIAALLLCAMGERGY